MDEKMLSYSYEISQIIEDAIEKHGIDIDKNDENIKSLVNYVLLIGYNKGYRNNTPTAFEIIEE